MPLKLSQIHEILNSKRDEFSAFNQETWKQLQNYRTVLANLNAAGEAEIRQQSIRYPINLGARLLEPLEQATYGVIPSRLSWQSKEQSLAWVRQRLTGITTFAVDGSQIYPGKDLSIPIALVQIGWFENLHLPTGEYEKDIALDVMTPSDLQVGNSGDPVDRRVNMRRFQMETERLIDYIKAHPKAKDCLVFLDGSLIATFAEAFEAKSRQFYVECLLDLLATSQKYEVPLVAYIDTSYAQDLSVMLRTLYDLPASQSIHDAQLLNKYMEWGDRTPLFLCQRSGILGEYEDQADQIAFTYLKTNRDSYPARLEIPLWVYQAGLLDRVIDWVRGEVIIGSGYPYVIETADQTAVLQAADRQAFFKILQDWAEQEDLNLHFSRKMVSKVRRR
ncbi:MAG: DNA double-strand break repair nuclease NurA [Cyanobacteria bacterium RM1_2_2]|nr:DNA double-strand break repair nuclease NurA [Cyanobacteria bacterium RM1_2_2]